MAEMDFKTATSTMEALVRISVSIPVSVLWLDVSPNQFSVSNCIFTTISPKTVILRKRTDRLGCHVPTPERCQRPSYVFSTGGMKERKLVVGDKIFVVFGGK